MSIVEIHQLNIYPLKSAKGLSLDSFTLGAMGPDYDRRWMVVDANGQFLSQRQLAKMCLLKTVLEQGVLHLSAPGFEELKVESALTVEREAVVWSDTVRCLDCGDEAAAWLSRVLAVNCRLVYMPEHCRRPVNPQFAHHNEIVSFADAFPLLLISEASLQDLNSRLSYSVAMERFRPNLVVRGCDAFAEDGWKKLRIAGVEFTVAKPCARCAIPSIDPQTGEKDSEILQVLARYRRRDGAVYFGQNLLFDRPGVLSVGDTVEIIA
jgi:uncharacterized protein YcbX